MDKTLDRRDEILTNAGELFRAHGYHATSMRDIAKALNLRGSSLYAHVTSKEEMLWEIVTHAADAFLAKADAVDPALPADAQLRALICGHLEVIAEELPHATVFFHEWKFLSPDLKDNITARRDAYERRFRDTLEAGAREGLFEVEDPKLATLFVLSSLNWTYQWFNKDGELSLNELTEKYTTLIFNALNAK